MTTYIHESLTMAALGGAAGSLIGYALVRIGRNRRRISTTGHHRRTR